MLAWVDEGNSMTQSQMKIARTARRNIDTLLIAPLISRNGLPIVQDLEAKDAIVVVAIAENREEIKAKSLGG